MCVLLCLSLFLLLFLVCLLPLYFFVRLLLDLFFLASLVETPVARQTAYLWCFIFFSIDRSLFENDEHDSHVVAANTLGAVLGEDGVEETGEDFLVWDVFVESRGDEVHQFLVGFAFPNTVASEEEESIRLGEDTLANIRNDGNHGFLWFFRVRLAFADIDESLVLEVTHRTREIQVAVDTSIGDEATCVSDALQFDVIVWLVVLRHGERG